MCSVHGGPGSCLFLLLLVYRGERPPWAHYASLGLMCCCSERFPSARVKIAIGFVDMVHSTSVWWAGKNRSPSMRWEHAWLGLSVRTGQPTVVRQHLPQFPVTVCEQLCFTVSSSMPPNCPPPISASPVSFSFLRSFAAVLSFLPNCFHFVAVHGDREVKYGQFFLHLKDLLLPAYWMATCCRNTFVVCAVAVVGV